MLENGNECSDMKILPFFSVLDPKEQALVFATDTENKSRICVISTNIAETSVTIPNVKYVVDCGKVKLKSYDSLMGSSKYAVDWISQASADQRAGRAGRMSEGYVYRLYTQALYGHMAKFTQPELLRCPINQIVLELKVI